MSFAQYIKEQEEIELQNNEDEIREKIADFIKITDDIDNSSFNVFASEELGMDEEEAENYVFTMLRELLLSADSGEEDEIEESNVVEVTPKLLSILDKILEIEDDDERTAALEQLRDGLYKEQGSSDEIEEDYDEEDEEEETDPREIIRNLINNGIMSKEGMIDTIISSAGGDANRNALEHINRHWDTNASDMSELIEILGTDDMFREVLTMVDTDELYRILDDNELTPRFNESISFSQIKAMLSEAAQTLKKFETPVDLGDTEVVGWKYDTNGNPVVVFTVINNGIERKKAIQAAEYDPSDRYKDGVITPDLKDAILSVVNR